MTPSLRGERVFLHISAFSRRGRRPALGDWVTYELSLDERRRPRASKVRFSGDAAPDSESRRPSAIPIFVACSFIAGLAGVVFAGRLPIAVLLFYVGASAATFAAYAFDKAAAREGRWRTPESTLHLFGLVGGWPGALFAQRVLRHKSRKAEFRRVFWVTVGLNCLAFGWLLTGKGSAFLAVL